MNKPQPNLKPLVNNPDAWPAFKEYLEDLLQRNYQSMANQTDLLLLGRDQGRVELIRHLLRLRETVNGRD